MKKARAEETKKLIREAAYKLFLIKGYETSSLKDLEKNTHVARGCLYYHYQSKQELFIDVIDYYVLHSLTTKDGGTDDGKPLWKFINDHIQNIQVMIDEMKQLLYPNTQTAIIRGYINLVLKAEEYYPDFSTHIYQIIQNELRLWESTLTHAKEKGEIKSTCDISLLARLFRNLFTGVLYQNGMVCEQKLIEELREVYRCQYRLISKKQNEEV